MIKFLFNSVDGNGFAENNGHQILGTNSGRLFYVCIKKSKLCCLRSQNFVFWMKKYLNSSTNERRARQEDTPGSTDNREAERKGNAERAPELFYFLNFDKKSTKLHQKLWNLMKNWRKTYPWLHRSDGVAPAVPIARLHIPIRNVRRAREGGPHN